jgi:hypothetical protein
MHARSPIAFHRTPSILHPMFYVRRGDPTPLSERVELSVRHLWIGVWNPIRHLILILLRDVQPIVLRLAGQVNTDKSR